VQAGACPNENAAADIAYDAHHFFYLFEKAFAELGLPSEEWLTPLQLPSSVGECAINHRGRVCQQLLIGDISVEIDDDLLGPHEELTIPVRAGQSVPFVIHNNGCWGVTEVQKTVSRLGGSLSCPGSRDAGTRIEHFYLPPGGNPSTDHQYFPDRDAIYQTPRTGEREQEDTWVFSVDGRPVTLTFVVRPDEVPPDASGGTCAHPQLRALDAAGTSFMGLTLGGTQRDCVTSQQHIFDRSRLYVMPGRRAHAILALGFDGSSVRIILDGDNTKDGGDDKLGVVACYPSARATLPPEKWVSPVTRKPQEHHYTEDELGNLRIFYATRAMGDFVARIIPTNSHTRHEGVSKRAAYKLTGSLSLQAAQSGSLRGHFYAPFFFEWRNSETREVERLARMGMDGCFSLRGAEVELVPDVASREALEEAARIKPVIEGFARKSDAWEKKNRAFIESLKRTRDPRALVALTSKMQAMQREAMALKVEGQRVGALARTLEVNANKRAQRVWTILERGVTIRP